MASIDDKVVAMSFENSKFESGVHSTLNAIERLKSALNFHGAGKGLENINNSANKMNFGHLGQSVDSIQAKFSVLGVAAVAALASIALKAVTVGASLVKSFALDPVKAGFAEYSTNLNSIQTILANTQASGATLEDVNAALLNLNKYSDQTIYNFSQMARNIGTFTAAGVDLDTSTQAIKGIANLAALSGSNSDQASTAMYQLSQAISAGRVGLQDWNSVVNAGMGGTVFQRALATTAENMGTLKQGTLKLVGPMKNVSINGESFRQSMQAGPGKQSWLTSKVLTQTLKQFTGDLSDAELAAQGFTKAQIKAIQMTAQTAKHAATEVKTISQVLDVAKETAGSGWAQTFQIIFGDFGEAKETFTALSNVINGFINTSADARNKVLGDWKALGGRVLLIDSIKLAFKNLILILKPIKEAFREIFPATTGADLFRLTALLHQLAAAMKPSAETVENLKRTFKGLFALLDIGKMIIQGVFTMLKSLFSSVGGGSGGFLSLTGSIGDFIVKIRDALKEGDGLTKFFTKLGEFIAIPIKFLKELGSVIAGVFGGFSSGGFTGEVSAMTAIMAPFKKIIEGISNIAPKFFGFLKEIATALKPAFDAYMSILNGFGTAIGEAATNMNFDAILQVIKTGLFAALVLAFKNFFGKGSAINQLVGLFGGKGIFSSIAGSFKALEGSMVAIQQNIKAKTLKEIAIAIGILAVSVVALSFVDPDKLKKALVAITFMMGQLLAAMAVIDKIGKSAGFVKLPFIAASLVILAAAIDTLVIAVIALSFLSWEDLLKGLGGVSALLIGITAATGPLSANSAGMIKAGIGIAAISVSLLLLAVPVKIMGSMNLKDLGKGLSGMAVGLGALVIAMTKMPVVPLKSTVGLTAMAAAMVALSGAIKIMGSMDLDDLGKGLAGFAIGLGGMVIAMKYMPKGMMGSAAALVAVAGAMVLVSKAIVTMGNMSWQEIAKGLVALGGALVILAGGLYLMEGALGGAAALTVAAAGIALLAPALKTLGSLSWEEIIHSLVALGAAIGTLGVAALVLAPVIPAMIGLGAALVLIGGGLALAGAGVFLIGAGLSAIAVAGPAAVGILVAAMIELQKGVVENAKLLILGLLEIANAFAATAPKFVNAILKIIDALLDAIIRSLPKVQTAALAIINAILNVLNRSQDKIIKAAFDLIIALLKGLQDGLPKITKLVIDIIAQFISTIANNLSKIIKAGADLLVAFIKGIGDNYLKVVTAGVDTIVKFIDGMGNNLRKIVDAGADLIVKLIKGISGSLRDIVTAGADLIVKFITGIGNKLNDIVAAGVLVIIKFIQGIGANALLLAVAAMKTILDFLNGLTVAVNLYAPQIRTATMSLGFAIIDGMTFGALSKAKKLYDTVTGIAQTAANKMHIPFLSKSPSRVMIELGKNIILGMAGGLDSTAPKVYKSATSVSDGVIQKFRDTFGIKSPSKVMAEIGKEVGVGFALGIRGSADDIRGAFESLNDMLLDEMENATDTIADQKERLLDLEKDTAEKRRDLTKLMGEKKIDKEAVRQTNDDLKEMAKEHAEITAVITLNESILRKTTAAHKTLVDELDDEKKKLISLSNQYDVLGEKLKERQSELDAQRQERLSAISSYKDQYGALPVLDVTSSADILAARAAVTEEKKKLSVLLAAEEADAEAITSAQTAVAKSQADLVEILKGKTLDSTGNSVDQLATYENALISQTKAVGAYNSTLQRLREMGINENTYKKLVTDGVADQEFATQLVKGGQRAVDHLNKLDGRLDRVSQKLGKNAGDRLFNVGIGVTEGLIRGLKRDQHLVNDQMEKIAIEMLAAIKKPLGLKSPSKEFAKVGKFSMEGMALGLKKSSSTVIDASKSVAKDALTALQKSMRDISSAVLNELDTSPVITPVLDLTVVRGQSKELANLIPITAAASYGQAAIISAQGNSSQFDSTEAPLLGTSVKFEQNNYSPEALSAIEIYRQTRNQMAQLKSVLNTS